MKDAAVRVAELENMRGIGAVVRSAQLMTTMTEIAGALSTFWNRAGDIVSAGRDEAAIEALTQSLKWDDPLLRLAYNKRKRNQFKEWLVSPANWNIEAMLARVYKTRLPLSQQVYKSAALTQGWVERRINSAIARGEPVTQLANEVRDFINPNTKGGATYAARRLARTEINAAYHAVTVVHNEDKPWNTAMQWSLSRSHPELDVCDKMARLDHTGLGAGRYPKDDVPPKPHPQCFCFCYPIVLSGEDFLAEWRAGKYDSYILQTYGAR